MAAADDHTHVTVLSILHYVLGGITAFFSLFPCIYIAMGIAMVAGAFPPDQNGQEVPTFVGVLVAGMGMVFFVLGWALAGLMLYTGRCLGARRGWMYCIVVAALECAMVPLGTILGVFTIVVLVRPSVKAMFSGALLTEAAPITTPGPPAG